MYKVLVADDEVKIRSGLKHIINWPDYGFMICWEAENGAKALELIEKQKPDLVITDVKMPVMDGLDLLAHVSRNYPQIRISILSGYNDFSFVKTALRCKAVDYLLKPVDEEELVQLLEKVRIELDAENVQGQNAAAFSSGISAKASILAAVTNKAVAATIEYIKSHSAENITLKQASANVYISQSYLGKLFKEATGETFHDYLNKVRIERAKELFRTTDSLIYEICENVGYDSLDYFRKQFKNITGYSPNEYRSMIRA